MEWLWQHACEVAYQALVQSAREKMAKRQEQKET